MLQAFLWVRRRWVSSWSYCCASDAEVIVFAKRLGVAQRHPQAHLIVNNNKWWRVGFKLFVKHGPTAKERRIYDRGPAKQY